jgi:hypothetical protein
LLIKIVVFYERGSFLWSPKERPGFIFKKYFGDKDRALKKFNLKPLIDKDGREIFVPNDLKKLEFDYGNSEFLECNIELARQNLKTNYTQDQSVNEMVLPSLEYIVEYLESNYKHYFLLGGSLLGWYRDCGTIPFTTDVSSV